MGIVPENWRMGYEEIGLAWLSLASGCTDVLSFLKLGDVFTSAMTGNTALLAIAVGQGRTIVALRSLSALFGFMLGVALCTMIYNLADPERTERRRLRQLLLIEALFLGACAALWTMNGDPIPGNARYAVILLSAIGMGIQGAVASRINVSGISTIVFTSVLVRIVMTITGRFTRPAVARASSTSLWSRILTFAAYGCGAGLAGILASQYFMELLWVPMAAVLFALACSELAHNSESTTK
jgi:uncharacterized membrane protein YoaK (UPF0700 family)